MNREHILKGPERVRGKSRDSSFIESKKRVLKRGRSFVKHFTGIEAINFDAFWRLLVTSEQ